jgi:hypothetical protein
MSKMFAFHIFVLVLSQVFRLQLISAANVFEPSLNQAGENIYQLESFILRVINNTVIQDYTPDSNLNLSNECTESLRSLYNSYPQNEWTLKGRFSM